MSSTCQLLSKLFPYNSTNIDSRLMKSLFVAINSATKGSNLSLSALGRKTGELNQQIEKHSIKRTDRLIGNTKLQNCRSFFYEKITKIFSTTIKHPLISIDWSTVYNYDFVMLRASIAFSGRAVTIYEEVHPEKKMNNHQVHKQFLKKLSEILPQTCLPIICTDAGFKVPWFKLVESHNWYWLARSRGVILCRFQGDTHWKYIGKYHDKATAKATEQPMCELSKTHAHVCRVVLYKKKNKNRKNLNRQGMTTKDNVNSRQSKGAREPWFLVSNLPTDTYPPHQLVNLYSRRMTIEESFRDTKNEYYGLGLRRSRSRSTQRLQIILLIAALAQLILCTIGKAAEDMKLNKYFQVNTVKTKRVLSYTFLGKRILANYLFKIPIKKLYIAMENLVNEACYEN